MSCTRFYCAQWGVHSPHGDIYHGAGIYHHEEEYHHGAGIYHHGAEYHHGAGMISKVVINRVYIFKSSSGLRGVITPLENNFN